MAGSMRSLSSSLGQASAKCPLFMAFRPSSNNDSAAAFCAAPASACAGVGTDTATPHRASAGQRLSLAIMHFAIVQDCVSLARSDARRQYKTPTDKTPTDKTPTDKTPSDDRRNH